MGGRIGLPGAELERLSIEYNPDEVMIEDPDDMLLVEVRGLLLTTDNEVAATDTFAHPEAADGNKGPPEGEIRYPGALAAKSFSLEETTPLPPPPVAVCPIAAEAKLFLSSCHPPKDLKGE